MDVRIACFLYIKYILATIEGSTMSQQRSVGRILLGSEPKLRRMFGYLAATAVFYLFFIILVWVQVALGTTSRSAGWILSGVGLAGLLFFYGQVRGSLAWNIPHWKLALFQAYFAIACEVGAYAVLGPIRGATLLSLPVILVFCASSLRPPQMRRLCLFSMILLGATIAHLVSSDPLTYPLYVEVIHFLLAASAMVGVALLSGELGKLRSRLKQQKDDLLKAVATIRTLATVDELTLLATRRHMQEVMREEERRQATLGQPVCIALLDIDFFKNVNDQYGHAGGDDVLRTFSRLAQTGLRASDVLARWGGEEFLLLLPDTELTEAAAVLNRISQCIGAMRIPELDPALEITFSGGLVARRPSEPFADAIRRADEAMYLAKARGRARIVCG